MLKTPDFLLEDDVANLVASFRGGRSDARVLEPGAVEIGHFSLDLMLWGRNAPEMHMGWPYLIDNLNSYGVCDSPKQFLDRYRQMLSDDVRTFVVSFTHIAKDPGNRGQGGGWRWHKWGPYIGEGKPENEYLDDEDGFDAGVYCYHVYQTAGPKIEDPVIVEMRARMEAKRAR